MTTDRLPAHRLLPCFVLMVLLSACASNPQGRTKLTTPGAISDVYSDADMRLHLATSTSINTPCSGEECESNRAFDLQVQQLGSRLANAAYDAHPDLIHRIRHFEFDVAEKAEPGITSNASGKIVVLRGVQNLGLNENAMAFVLAREMGHIMAEHHQENTATKILFSVAATLLFPALNLFGNTATLAQATTATTASTAVATTAASTATSYVGSKLLLNNVHPDQMSEADVIALDLLSRMGYSRHAIAHALEDSPEFDGSSTWAEDFRLSVMHVKALDVEPVAQEEEPVQALPPLMEDPQEEVVTVEDATTAPMEQQAAYTRPAEPLIVGTKQLINMEPAKLAVPFKSVSSGGAGKSIAQHAHVTVPVNTRPAERHASGKAPVHAGKPVTHPASKSEKRQELLARNDRQKIARKQGADKSRSLLSHSKTAVPPKIGSAQASEKSRVASRSARKNADRS